MLGESIFQLAPIRQNSLVRYKTELLTDALSFRLPGEFQDGTPVVYIGEIPNLPGRGIFKSENHTYIGHKISNFEEVPASELHTVYFNQTI